MAFVVEDGSRVINSNSFVAVAFADTYHTDRGQDFWLGLDDDIKQKCLIRATDYLQKRFSRRWKGVKVSFTQSLDWPRMAVWDRGKLLLAQSNQIPTKLMQAVCEYALRAAIVGNLTPDAVAAVPAQDFSQPSQSTVTEYAGGIIRHSINKVGPITENTTFETPDALVAAARNKQVTSQLVTESLIPEYPGADLLIEDFLLNVSGKRLVRG